MISPVAAPLILKHFDSIDKVVSKRVSRKRPWSEPALTSLLCDLLDRETQSDEKISYSIKELNRDLKKRDSLLKFSIELITHEYPPLLERWITQSDIGLIIKFRDHFLPKHSWDDALLLQAKRLYPSSPGTNEFDETSRFQGFDRSQHERIVHLHEKLGLPLVHYLWYCPRPNRLSRLTRKKLSHLRNQRLGSNIFDYTAGQLLREELMKPKSSLEAGMFVSLANHIPTTLGDVHESVLRECMPFSWFILNFLIPFEPYSFDSEIKRTRRRPNVLGQPENDNVVFDIVSGNTERIVGIFNDLPTTVEKTPVLPAHTLQIGVELGDVGDPDRQVIRFSG